MNLFLLEKEESFLTRINPFGFLVGGERQLVSYIYLCYSMYAASRVGWRCEFGIDYLSTVQLKVGERRNHQCFSILLTLETKASTHESASEVKH